MANVAIVGANRGIGLEFCRQYKEAGHEVYTFCRKSSPELDALGVNVTDGCEVANEDVVAAIAKKFSPAFFDTFVHVSGIMKRTAWPNFDNQAMIDQFLVNSLAPLTTIRQFAETIKPGAKVAVLTSRMGSIADNDSGGAYGYRMSKAALNAGIKSLSIDTRDKEWTVLTLHPGWVQTDMTGGTGLINTQQSVEGLIKILNEKQFEDSGRFFHTNGEELPW